MCTSEQMQNNPEIKALNARMDKQLLEGASLSILTLELLMAISDEKKRHTLLEEFVVAMLTDAYEQAGASAIEMVKITGHFKPCDDELQKREQSLGL